MSVTEARARESKKWESANVERLTIKLYKGKAPTREDIKRAAARVGMSLNGFVVECIQGGMRRE